MSWLFLIFAGIWVVLVFRTFQIQVIDSEKYSAVASSQAHDRIIWKPERGKIYDRHGRIFADNIKEEKEGYLESRRIFPQGTLASQLIGQVGRDGQGLRGLEFLFDGRLRGVDGWLQRVKDSRRRIQPGLESEGREPVPGMNLVLTIDRDMQEIVENALRDGVESYEAESGSAVVVDPHTGEILAMASYPTYDPNVKSAGGQRANRNDIISFSFEPGSIFKLVTASAALEEHVVAPAQKFSGEGGRWTLASGDVIRDTHDHGEMNMTEAMTYSSNIVFAKIADAIGPETFFRFVRAYGFGSKTLVELPGEESGMLKPIYLWSGRTLKTMGFGHEIMVTPLQMVMAFAAVANGGKLMQPTIVREWQNPDGSAAEKNEPIEVRRVVSEETAARVRHMLREVVDKGTAKSVVSKKLPNIEFGGKTGTAEKYNQELKRYDHTKQVASFIGFAPALNPRYVCMVLVDDPKTMTVGGLTAGPVFRNIMEGIYYHPQLSPLPYNLARVSTKSPCEVDFVGLSKTDVAHLSDSRNCHVTFEREGDVVVSQETDLSAKNGVRLTMGALSQSKMPDLKGLSLRDALDVMGNSRASVEYTGKGRVAEQFPEPETPLSRGQICKLVLKERG
jgi:cell division protein FtsI/penicillin-binding protein 2